MSKTSQGRPCRRGVSTDDTRYRRTRAIISLTASGRNNYQPTTSPPLHVHETCAALDGANREEFAAPAAAAAGLSVSEGERARATGQTAS